jgi:hypothetical protein
MQNVMLFQHPAKAFLSTISGPPGFHLLELSIRRATFDDGHLVSTLPQTHRSDSKGLLKWTKPYAAEGPNSATLCMKGT